MAAQPLFYLRGTVYVIKFPSDENPGQIINKYLLCLQGGRILKDRRSFVGVLLTTCKTNEAPRVPPWTMYVSPAESHTEYGVIVDCGQVYTIPMADVVDTAYALCTETMQKVDRALMFGVGILKVEDFKKDRPQT